MSYIPRLPPTELDDLQRYIAEELQEISNVFSEMSVDHIMLNTHHVAPNKPREGNLYRADGSDWNPGSGEGIYEYTNAGSWSKL